MCAFFQLLNWPIFTKIDTNCRTLEATPTSYAFHFLKSVITKWQMHRRLRWNQQCCHLIQNRPEVMWGNGCSENTQLFFKITFHKMENMMATWNLCLPSKGPLNMKFGMEIHKKHVYKHYKPTVANIMMVWHSEVTSDELKTNKKYFLIKPGNGLNIKYDWFWYRLVLMWDQTVVIL